MRERLGGTVAGFERRHVGKYFRLDRAMLAFRFERGEPFGREPRERFPCGRGALARERTDIPAELACCREDVDRRSTPNGVDGHCRVRRRESTGMRAARRTGERVPDAIEMLDELGGEHDGAGTQMHEARMRFDPGDAGQRGANALVLRRHAHARGFADDDRSRFLYPLAGGRDHARRAEAADLFVVGEHQVHRSRQSRARERWDAG